MATIENHILVAIGRRHDVGRHDSIELVRKLLNEYVRALCHVSSLRALDKEIELRRGAGLVLDSRDERLRSVPILRDVGVSRGVASLDPTERMEIGLGRYDQHNGAGNRQEVSDVGVVLADLVAYEGVHLGDESPFVAEVFTGPEDCDVRRDFLLRGLEENGLVIALNESLKELDPFKFNVGTIGEE